MYTMKGIGGKLRRDDWIAGLKAGALAAVTVASVFVISASVISQPASARADELIGNAEVALPPRVSESVLSAVAVQRDAAVKQADGRTAGVAASGVAIGDDLILTAGHAVVSDGRLQCAGSRVDAPGVKRPDDVSRDTVASGSAIYGRSADIALLKVNAGENFRGLPTAHLSTSELRREQLVYFVNYQAAADGTTRTPYKAADPETSSMSLPAVYSAVVLGKTRFGYAVATNLRSHYSAVPEQFLRQGGSGGPVFDIQGRLTGLSVATDALTPAVSARTIATSYGVNLPAGQYQIAYVQPVSQPLIDSLQADMRRCAR